MSTILIADDSKAEGALMAQLAQSLGHHTLLVENGEACIAHALKHLPNLILLDIVMPETDGFKVCQQLKKNDATKAIPIIMVSSKNQRSDKFWAERLGANDYVTKPFTPEALAEKIRQHLR